jgi:hypothetical protein
MAKVAVGKDASRIAARGIHVTGCTVPIHAQKTRRRLHADMLGLESLAIVTNCHR